MNAIKQTHGGAHLVGLQVAHQVPNRPGRTLWDFLLRFLAIRKDEEDKVSEKRKAYYQAKRQQLEKKRKSGDAQPRERGRSRQDEGVRE